MSLRFARRTNHRNTHPDAVQRTSRAEKAGRDGAETAGGRR